MKTKTLLLLTYFAMLSSRTIAQEQLWVGETYQCFMEDYANKSLKWLNINWTIDSGLIEDYDGTYVRTVSFEEFKSGTYNVKVSWTETDMSDYAAPFYHKSHTWSFTCIDNPLVLDKDNLTLTKGKTETINVSHTFSNEYTSKAKVTFESDKPDVATVSNTGVVTAKSEGTAIITVKSTISKDAKKCSVKVAPNIIYVTSISITDNSSEPLKVGATRQLKATVYPSNATNKGVTWSSNPTSVAEVSSSGLVTAKGDGEATITCQAKDGSGVKETCKVTVVPVGPVEPTDISLPDSMSIAVGERVTLSPTITPSNAETTLSWTSYDEDIVMAYANGIIEGISLGTTTIRVMTHNKLPAWCTVTVKPAPQAISLSPDTISVLEGNAVTLTPIFTPSDATSTLTWTSEDTSIATVTPEGIIKGVGMGETKIWVKTYNRKSASCIVKVEYNPDEIIVFADANVKALCVDNWDTDGDGELRESEAAAVKDLGEVFKSNKEITSFNELQYFTGLTEIFRLAFYGCNGLTSITIPDKVTSIGNSAFNGCNGLTSITIPNSVTTMGTYVFAHCDGLISVDIGKNLTNINDYSFYDCDALVSVTIGSGVTCIGQYAFSLCDNLTSIIIPDNVTSIGTNSFSQSGLKSVIIGNGLEKFGLHPFYSCDSLSSIIVESGNPKFDSRNNCNAIIETATNELIVGCRNTIIPNSVTCIGNNAFYGCHTLTSITIGNGVTSIDIFAFGFCDKLTSVVIPQSVSTIYFDAFIGCNALTSVTVKGEMPAKLWEDSFSHPENATLYVPWGSKTAYQTADYWKEFKEIEEEDIIIQFEDAMVHAICVANWDKNGDGNLSVSEAAAVTSLGSVFMNSKIDLFNELKFFKGLTSIGSNAFEGCSSLTSLTIPNSVTSIGGYAFSGCSGLTSVTIPNSVTSIGSNAFNGCIGLTSITIPNSITGIGYSAFSECDNLSSVIIESNSLVSKKRKESIFGEQVKEYIIGNLVTSIGDYAFEGCSGLTSVTIGKNVADIGNYAFQGCDNLSSVTLESNAIVSASRTSSKSMSSIFGNQVKEYIIGDAVTSIGSYAFWYCIDLTSVVISESVTSISNNAFGCCFGLTSIIIPENMTSIDDKAFYRCYFENGQFVNKSSLISNDNWGATLCEEETSDGLLFTDNILIRCRPCVMSVSIPESVTNIGEYAFESCQRLTNVTIPMNVKSIGKGAFQHCCSLAFINIPQGVTNIGGGAFNYCSSLNSCRIPNSVTYIGFWAFKGCSSLTDVFCYAENVPETWSDTFQDTPISEVTLHVPASAIEQYRATKPWSQFQRIIELTTIEITLADGTDYNNSHLKLYDALHYSRIFKNTYWQAWYVPFDVTLTSEIMENFAFAEFAGTYTEEDGSFYITVVRLKEGDVVKANTPYCVQAKAADSTNPQVITQTDAILKPAEENSFFVLSAEKKITFGGNYTRRAVTEEDHNVYAMSGGKYSKQKTGNTLSSFRCFFTIEDREDNPYASSNPNPAEVKLMVLGDDNQTEIAEMKNEDNIMKNEDGAVFDLAGRKVKKQYIRNGLYIRNGKKVIVKK